MLFFWSVSETCLANSKSEIFSENAHSFAASFVHINAHLPQAKSFFSRYDPSKCITSVVQFASCFLTYCAFQKGVTHMHLGTSDWDQWPGDLPLTPAGTGLRVKCILKRLF